MLFAIFGYPELTLGLGVVAIAVAAAVIYLFFHRQQFKRIPIAVIAGLVCAIGAAVVFYYEAVPAPGDAPRPAIVTLDDLQADEQVGLGDAVVFDVRVNGRSDFNVTLPVVLKVKDKDGVEREVDSAEVEIEPPDRAAKRVRLSHVPTEIGKYEYRIEVDHSKHRKVASVTKIVSVVKGDMILALYIEGQPRYEFRYLRAFLGQRPAPEAKKQRASWVKVILFDADDDFNRSSENALEQFPETVDALRKYDMLIIGDCDPVHPKLKPYLKNIVEFARGKEDAKDRTGGGVLFLAGAFHNPHRFKRTPLADILPVEPLADEPPADKAITDRMRPMLTPLGRVHPLIRFGPNNAQNLETWERLPLMYWSSSGYVAKEGAEVLMVHPTEKVAKGGGPLPLIVQQKVGAGRSMFMGIDETWRWRGGDEAVYRAFWTNTLRYLAPERQAGG